MGKEFTQNFLEMSAHAILGHIRVRFFRAAWMIVICRFQPFKVGFMILQIQYRMVGAGVTFLEPRTAIESNDEPCKTFFLGARRSPCFSFGRNACILIVFMHVHVLYVIIVMHLSMCSYLYSCLCVLMYRF